MTEKPDVLAADPTAVRQWLEGVIRHGEEYKAETTGVSIHMLKLVWDQLRLGHTRDGHGLCDPEYCALASRLARPAPPSEGLDVELLAAAICNGEAGNFRYEDFDEEGREAFRVEARKLAREYAALPPAEPSVDDA